jgi:hypothetical protein
MALTILAGTGKALERKELTQEEREIYDSDFDLLVNDLTKLVDPDLGRDLSEQKEFYAAVAEVAKGYFDKPFGGLKCSTGEYGMRFIIPQDFRTQSGGGDGYQYYSWFRTLTTSSGESDADLWGSSSNPILAETEAEHRTVIAFHRLLSYKPDPRLIMLQLTINSYPYTPYGVEPFAKIMKDEKMFKVIPLPGGIVLHPGGKLYLKVWFDPQSSGTTVMASTTTVDTEIAPFGLLFGEQAYLNIDDAIV